MKILTLTLMFAFSVQTSRAGMTSSMPSTFLETGIPNSHLVSENIIRGMAPRNKNDLQNLLNLGVEKFLMFKIDTNGDIAKQMENLSAFGILQNNLIHIAFPWKDVTDYDSLCEMTVDGLNILRSSDQKNEKLYLHCTVGEDRTGYLAGLYKLYRGDNETPLEIFESELCDKGYEAGNPKKPYHVVKKIREALTPAFLAMANLIQKNPGKTLTKSMCKNLQLLKVDWKKYSCKKTKLI